MFQCIAVQMLFSKRMSMDIYSSSPTFGAQLKLRGGNCASLSSRDISLLIKSVNTATDFALNTLAYVIFTNFKGQSVIKLRRKAPCQKVRCPKAPQSTLRQMSRHTHFLPHMRITRSLVQLKTKKKKQREQKKKTKNMLRSLVSFLPSLLS